GSFGGRTWARACWASVRAWAAAFSAAAARSRAWWVSRDWRRVQMIVTASSTNAATPRAVVRVAQRAANFRITPASKSSPPCRSPRDDPADPGHDRRGGYGSSVGRPMGHRTPATTHSVPDLTRIAGNAPRQPRDRARKVPSFPDILLEPAARAAVWSWQAGVRPDVGTPAGTSQRGTAIMSTPAEVRMARRVLRHELESIRGNWGWILALGIILIVGGTLAIAMPLAASLGSALAFGALFLVGGIAQLVGAFWTRDWSGFFLTLLMGVV